MNYENEVKEILAFLKLDSAKIDPFPIFEDSLTLSLRRNIYKVGFCHAYFSSAFAQAQLQFQAFNAVQNDCAQFMKMYQYDHLLFEDFLDSLEYFTISVLHD